MKVCACQLERDGSDLKAREKLMNASELHLMGVQCRRFKQSLNGGDTTWFPLYRRSRNALVPIYARCIGPSK